MIGDFHAQIGETHLDTFLYQHELENINKEPTCYNDSENPSCIDFILSNRPKSFFLNKCCFYRIVRFSEVSSICF